MLPDWRLVILTGVEPAQESIDLPPGNGVALPAAPEPEHLPIIVIPADGRRVAWESAQPVSAGIRLRKGIWQDELGEPPLHGA